MLTSLDDPCKFFKENYRSFGYPRLQVAARNKVLYCRAKLLLQHREDRRAATVLLKLMTRNNDGGVDSVETFHTSI